MIRLHFAVFGVVFLFLPAGLARSASAEGLTPDTVRGAPGKVVPLDPEGSVAGVELVRDWNGSLCRPRLVHKGKDAVRIKEVVLFTLPLSLPSETALYGEGAQMLSQTGGTLGQPFNLSQYRRRPLQVARPARRKSLLRHDDARASAR